MCLLGTELFALNQTFGPEVLRSEELTKTFDHNHQNFWFHDIANAQRAFHIRSTREFAFLLFEWSSNGIRMEAEKFHIFNEAITFP